MGQVMNKSATETPRRWKGIPHHRSNDGTVPVSHEMIAAVVPEHLLQQDEIVLILTKPSLWFIVLTSFRFILTTVLLGILTVQLLERFWVLSPLTPQTVAVVTVLVVLGRLIWGLLVWTSHIYMLTNQRVVTIKGVINVHVFQAPLRKVQRTALYLPWVMRILGIGTVGLATAATTGFDSTWVMIGRPLQTHEQVVAAINKMS